MRTPVRRIEMIGGMFILLGILGLIALMFIPGVAAGKFLNSFEFKVQAAEGVGLSRGNKVMMQQIQIGEVTDLHLPGDQVIISCKVQPRYRAKMTTGVSVVLVPGTLFDSPHVVVRPGAGELLPEGKTLQAATEVSVLDRLGTLTGTVGETLESIRLRVGQLEGTLTSLEKILDAVNTGKGSLGKVVYESDLVDRLSAVVTQVDTSFKALDKLRGQLEDFAEVLPEAKGNVREMIASLSEASRQLKEGMARFPETMAITADALTEGRRVIESMKRSFLIRGNLPRELEPEGTAPASQRVPVSLK